MIELKYKGWKELPIGKYFELRDLCKNGGNDFDIIALLCNCDANEVMDIPIIEVNRIREQCGWIRKPFKPNYFRPDRINLNGKRYRVYTDFRKITAAQYIDFQTFYEDREKNYCNILTCFIIPEGKKYGEGYDPIELAEIFKNELDIETAENACFFFARRSKHSIQQGLIRLIWEVGMMMMRTKGETKERMKGMMKELMLQKNYIDGFQMLML